ncbi:MAG: presqualene diphosphate synthase HpnD [Candidatus Rokubacteria bacterium]|nr:presqualene diphosphate synthase HpnD [Candidatus Rokubacteria bacterium]MBI3826644.1 presqualene diphosphate synthase HpnD [Candidatus Rokubacteria bacterium]
MNVGELCARLTRQSRSNFYYAFLTLPRPRRKALYAVYAFCRTVDDIADLGVGQGVGHRAGAPAQRAALAGWRAEVARCYDGGAPEHPIAQRLAAAVRTFPIPREALLAVVDGVEMDLDHPTYETIEDLIPYCYRVASAVGLAAIEIFGYRDPRARDYAVNLGIALQLTNIIRDVGVDARNGRVYLPQEDLRKFGVTGEDLCAARYGERFVGLMRHEAERAKEYYRAAREAFPAGDARSLVAAEIMGAIYRALLAEIEARAFRVLGEPVALPTRRKIAIALRCWAGARVRASVDPGRAA